jgi:DNA-binding transcriptional LysR family regulator
MNLRQLEVFQAVMQAGNMSAAARLICITPSAVSKTISHTEMQLGYALFIRDKGALTPTPEAQVLFEESSAIHHKLDGFRRIALNLRHADEGHVRLAAIPAICHEFLPRVLEKHLARYPRASVEVRTLNQDQIAQALVTRSVDFALGYYEDPHPLLTNTWLISGPLYVVVTRDLWLRAVRARSKNPMLFLASLPLIRLVGEDPMCKTIDELALQLGLPDVRLSSTPPGLRVQTSRLALELVKRGLGWTVVDYLSASNLDPASIAALPLHDFSQMPLQMYCAAGVPLGQGAKRLQALLPDLLREVTALGNPALK